MKLLLKGFQCLTESLLLVVGYAKTFAKSVFNATVKRTCFHKSLTTPK